MSLFLVGNRRITTFGLILVSILFLGIGCAGATGPAGPAGPAGQSLTAGDTSASDPSTQSGQSSQGEVKIEWLSWSFFRITTPGGKVILTNPWYTNPDSSIGLDDIPEADIILVPAGHPDEVGNAR